MSRLVLASLILALMAAAPQDSLATGDSAGACTALKAPDIQGCKPVDVAAISKSYLDLYRIEGGKAVLDRSLKKNDICVPFKATDCRVPEFLMIEAPDRARLLFHRSDLRDEGAACTCDRTAQESVAGAPGAGRPNICPAEMCR